MYYFCKQKRPSQKSQAAFPLPSNDCFFFYWEKMGQVQNIYTSSENNSIVFVGRKLRPGGRNWSIYRKKQPDSDLNPEPSTSKRRDWDLNYWDYKVDLSSVSFSNQSAAASHSAVLLLVCQCPCWLQAGGEERKKRALREAALNADKHPAAAVAPSLMYNYFAC